VDCFVTRKSRRDETTNDKAQRHGDHTRRRDVELAAVRDGTTKKFENPDARNTGRRKIFDDVVFVANLLLLPNGYLVSLPWFLLFPVAERWAYPKSNAMRLSDLWSSRLSMRSRPISALNHSFPSTHVSLTVVVIAICWLFEVRLRNTVTALGVTVTLATFPLGIHWVADILAGAAAVALSVALARRVTDTSEREALALGHTVSLREKRVV
jgi:PAP2 superfamily protein